MSKISRGHKGEEKVISILKKRKEHFKIINNFTFYNEKSEMSHQIDHIFINCHGVFVIETKNYFGDIKVIEDENIWLKTVKKETIRIANPLKQNKSHKQIIKRILESKYDVISLVVFIRNNAPYLGDENVINFKDLNAFIDCYPYRKELNEEEIDDAYKIIKSNASKISKKEHLENIAYITQINKEKMEEIVYAIETHICPRCNGKMIENNFEYCCQNCNFKFQL